MENYITSKKLIKEIIRNNSQFISKFFVVENASGNDIKEIITLAKKNGVSFLPVKKQKILSTFNQGYSGLLLVLSPVKYFNLDEFYNLLPTNRKNVILILDEIIDPQNFGAILRNAAAFNVNGVIIQQWNQSPVTPTVVNVSRGAAYKVPIVKVKNVFNSIVDLKKNNFWVYAAVTQEFVFYNKNLVEINEIISNNRIAIILGNEDKGIRKNLLNECDGLITIKHSDKIESLNVATSCGIILYELYKEIEK